jgi:zinc and cadmium transporter
MNVLVSTPTGLLVGYCILALLAALAGGALPTLFKLTHPRLQIAVSFVAGLMLGLALLGLLPHAIGEIHSASSDTGWLLGGFLLMFFLQRFLPFHHHDVSEGSPVEPCGHPHSLAERSARGLTWMGLAVGLSLHSLFDGLAMAAAVVTDSHGTGSVLGLEHFKLNYSRFYFGKDHAGNFTEENEGNEERLVFPDSKLRFLRYLL